MKLIFLGPPGAGKGTQAERVIERLGVPQISTGELLRRAMKEGSETGVKARGYIESGALVPDEIVLDLVAERLAQPDCQNGYLLDGFPRTLNQAEALERVAQMDAVVNIQVPDEVIVRRLSGRRVCAACGHTTHVDLAPDGVCPKCGKPLTQRKDDDASAVANRLVVYAKQTQPLIEYYEKKGLLLSVDGCQEMNAVTEEILARLQELGR